MTDGIFEQDGAMVDLPRLVSYALSKADGRVLTHHFHERIELEHKYKYCLLDESIPFGTVGRTGRGLTELSNILVCVS